jgi:hypothetical protein
MRISDLVASAIHDSAHGCVRPAYRRWRPSMAGHADARALPECQASLSAKINAKHNRSGGAASFQLSFLRLLVITGIGTPLLERTTQPLSRSFRSLEATSYDAAFSPHVANSVLI